MKNEFENIFQKLTATPAKPKHSEKNCNELNNFRMERVLEEDNIKTKNFRKTDFRSRGEGGI